MKETKTHCFIDSNVWLYSFIKSQSVSKAEIVKSLVDRSKVIVSLQVINEVVCNILKKIKISEEEIQKLIDSFFEECEVILSDKLRYISIFC